MILGSRDIGGEFLITPQQLRNDYVRSGATPGGVGGGVFTAACEMVVDGSGVGGVTYNYGPAGNESWVVYDVVVGFVCGTGAGPVVWGTMANPLTNGISVQLNRVSLTETQGITTLLSNTDLMRLGQLSRDDDGVSYVALATLRFPSIAGIVLHGRLTDRLQFIVQDDMTAVGGGTTLWAYVRGYRMT